MKIKNTIDNILFIDEEINDYFSKLESNILKYMNNKNGIKFITDEKNLMKLIYNEELYIFIFKLYRDLNIKYHNSCIQNDIFDINLNKTIIDEYKNTHLISQCGETIFNELIVNSLNLNFILLTAINLGYSDKLLSLLNLSNLLNININHSNKKDKENRIKGILLNIKYRLIKLIKTQIIDSLDVLDIQENIA